MRAFLTSEMLVAVVIFSLVFKTGRTSSCVEERSDWGPVDINSPNYPMGYDSNLDCYWHFTVTTSSIVKIEFSDIELTSFRDAQKEQDEGCPNDYLEIYDGSTKDSLLLARICSMATLEFVSSGNTMFLHLHTDDSNEYRGFFAMYSGVCETTLSAKAGDVMSPNFPDTYPASQKCEWLIDLGQGYDVRLIFSAFQLEAREEDGCPDYVIIQEGAEGSGQEVTKYCANELPPAHYTQGPMKVKFVSDGDKEFSGFNASYITYERNECLIPGACHSNATCTNTDGSYTCICLPSYTGNGKDCVWYREFNECTEGHHNCHEDANCVDTRDHFTCECSAGFLGDGLNCTDVNECFASGPHQHNCHRNATCANTHGSFTCTCIAAYTGDGISCSDIDECQTNSHNCHVDATCFNTDGSFYCQCDEGYSGNGIFCEGGGFYL